jgi:hypothetical protein
MTHRAAGNGVPRSTFFAHRPPGVDADRTEWTSRDARRFQALSSPNRWEGRRRAAFWRTLGFPNLVEARKVSARNRRARKQARLERLAKLDNPFALSDREKPRGILSRQVRPVSKQASSARENGCVDCWGFRSQHRDFESSACQLTSKSGPAVGSKPRGGMVAPISGSASSALAGGGSRCRSMDRKPRIGYDVGLEF